MLSRKDKKVLAEIEYLLMVSNEGAVPSMKASSTERTIVSNVKSYDNFDGNHKKFSGMKKHYIRKIDNLIDQWTKQLTGEKVYKPETKQCKATNCSNPNKRVPLETLFCSYCGKEYING